MVFDAAAQPVADADAQPVFAAATQPVADSPTTISLRADRVQLARFEALVSAAGGEHTRPAGPAAQIIIHQCPDCERATVTTSRGEKRVAPAQLATLACDARVQRPGKPNRATIKPSVRAAVLARDRHRCATPGCRSTHFLEVHHVKPRGQGGTNLAETLITLCSRCHEFVHEGGGAGTVATPAPSFAPAPTPARTFAQIEAD